MNIKKLKQNPKKLKKLKTDELLEVFKLTQNELQTIIENMQQEKIYITEDIISWEKFLDEVSETLDSRE